MPARNRHHVSARTSGSEIDDVCGGEMPPGANCRGRGTVDVVQENVAAEVGGGLLGLVARGMPVNEVDELRVAGIAARLRCRVARERAVENELADRMPLRH